MDMITYISTYGFQCFKRGNGIPVEVGAADRDHFLYNTRDNTGDNISAENAYYGELTALYWIWKNSNFKEFQYIAFRHYNKCLKISKAKACGYLQDHPDGWVVAEACDIPAHAYPEEWRAFCEIIRDEFPFYYDALTEAYHEEDGSGNQCNAANMFITSAEQLDHYCEVLFEICKRLRRKIGNNEHEKYYKRYCAFMAERFLTVFIKAHAFPMLEVPVCRNKAYLKGIKKMAEITGINKRSVLVQKIKNRLYKNSYFSSYKN